MRVEILDRHRKTEVQKNLEDWTKSPVSLLFFKNIRKIRIGEELIHWVSCGEGPVKGSQWLAQHDNLDEKFLLARSEPEDFPAEALVEIRQERLLSTEQEMEFPPCQIEIVIGVEGRLFVVLPTGVETELPFAINAPFIQDPTRFKIKSPSVSPTNRWLLERAGKLAADVFKNWLQRPDLPLSDRAKAYNAMPDVDRKKTSLDSACGTLVEEAFEAEIAEAAIALTEDGNCVESQDAVLLPHEIYDAWPQKQAIGFFDEAARPAIAMDVEPFVHKSLDSESTKPWLKLIGVSDQPTGPEKLLARLSALASSKTAPAHEVEKWYRRLDQLIDGCSTDIFKSICAAFRVERLILTDTGEWEGSEGVFLNAGDEEIPDAPVIRASVRDLTLWRKIGVGDRPTGDLIMRWLGKLESGSILTQEDVRRVRGLLPRFPVRIWNECAHWLNLAGEWVPISDLKFSLSMQTLTAFAHLHPWVKKQTADLRLLPVEVVEAMPFSQLPALAAQIDERLELDQIEDSRGEARPWLRELGLMLLRIKLEDGDDSDKLRVLAAQLSETLWYGCAELETLPYIEGKPAGTARRADVLWIDECLYAERKPLAKLAKSVAQEIGKAFRRADIVDAIKLCFDRDAAFVRSYMEENFDLLPEAEVPRVQNPVVGDETAIKAAPSRDPSLTNDTEQAFDDDEEDDAFPDDDSEQPDTHAAGDDVSDNDDTGENPNAAEPTVVHPRKPPDVKPHIMERFALSQGFRKDGDGSFFNDQGCTIGKANGASFPWEQRSQDGDLLKHYWAKDHCLEREPLELDAVIWGMLERSENYVLVLSDPDGDPIEVPGDHLIQLREREVLALHPATYRLVIEHDKDL
ncbi:hypothetical protein [Altericroceibacterium spongiae]|uniref:hypothetical protein n=1 Tax=Altericroceibacterium spongiae TaxID=2320269 RepID=UPI001EE624DF|nr:hypothetical protein [Altericroceibacterium spongiae]